MTKTVAELKKELATNNSERRALRRALKEAEKREMLSAKIALGEALSGVVFAESPEAMQALVQTLNEPEIADKVRHVLAENNDENSTPEEPEADPQWGSDAGNEQDDNCVPQAY